jgi:LPS-assembly lipoprotein
MRSLLAALILAVSLAGCGFQLRGMQGANLPYKSFYVALPETAQVRIWLERHINAHGNTQIVDSASDADAIFQQLQDERDKSVLSVNAQGRVREYRLYMIYSFRVVNRKGQELIPPNEVTLSRDITYDDSTILAKNLEENLLWRDMERDLVNQIMRRLAIAKPKNPDIKEEE